MKQSRKLIKKYPAVLMFLILAGKIFSQDWYNNGYTFYGVVDPIYYYDKSYELVFEDNFSSSGLNTNNWQTYYPWGRSLNSGFTGTGYERQYYEDDNVSVPGDGNLYLYTEIDPGYRNTQDIPNPFLPSNNVYFKYTSGMIFSKASYKAGKFEIRCKIPFVYSTWPAFWLFGGCQQEIDIFEMVNGSETSNAGEDTENIYCTYHKNSDCNDNETTRASGTIYDSGVELSANFHTYSVEWDDTKIIWRLDGNPIRQVYRYWKWQGSNNWPLTSGDQISTSAPPFFVFAPFPSEDTEMCVIVNTAVLYDRGAPPTPFVVDYIKVYTKSDCYTDKILCDNIIPSPGLVTAKTITNSSSCNFDVTSSQPIEMKALEEINLTPGFSVDVNSDFYAHITYCEDYEVKNYGNSEKPVSQPSKYPPSTFIHSNSINTPITSPQSLPPQLMNQINLPYSLIQQMEFLRSVALLTRK